MSVHARSRKVTGGAPCGAPRITRAEIARAVPAGSCLTRSGRTWLARLEADPAAAAMRSHGRANLLAVAAVYAGRVSRRHGTAWPGHDGVQAATGLDRSTVKRHVRWLREHGWLGTVRQGSTPATRRGARAGDGNEAAVYCLTLPRQPRPHCPGQHRKETAPPTSRRRKTLLLENNPGARERAGTPHHAETRPPAWRDGTLGRIPLPALLAIARPYTAAGWTPADLAHAVDHQPDGTSHWHTRRVRNPGGWARHRLSLWTAPDGTPARSRAQQLAEAARRSRAAAQQELPAPVAARAVRLRAVGGYASTADTAPGPSGTLPRGELLAALRERLGPACPRSRRDDRLTAAAQALESRRARGAAEPAPQP